jgi:two-component system cell cycle response regulator
LKILILDNDNLYSNFLKDYIQKHLLFADIDVVSSFKEAKQKTDYDLYILDYFIKDTKNAEHIKFFLDLGKRVILITSYDENLIENTILNRIVDFIFKDNFSIVYLKRLINRIYKNQFLEVLIVDDCNVTKIIVENYLQLLGFKNIFYTTNGQEALEFLEDNNINLIITDLNMPNVDGFELVKRIRKKVSMEELPILVISSDKNNNLLINTLKVGANDFIIKPFKKEEFFIRLINLLDIYDTINLYKTKMYIDPLTKVYNRLYLEIIEEELRNRPYAMIMIDIDYFKKINDTYGHLKGDEVLKHFAKIIKSVIRKNDYLIRYGGEEFLIILPEANKEIALKILQKIKFKLLTSDFDIKYTFSAGVADENLEFFEKIKLADERLYKAKRNGRNQFVLN